MKDPISLIRANLLHPKFRQQAIDFIEALEAQFSQKIRIVQGWRSFYQQQMLYAQGRTKPGDIVTYSPAGTSYHNYGVAIDICPFKIDMSDLDWKFDFSHYRTLAIDHGLQMGMDFPHPDYDHFENKFNKNWRDMLHEQTIKNFIPGSEYVVL